ncbi:right-handed parallel beta-helix repeat-containing protein [Akkermansiaceae bacterium]|nr:right-handed parallel beta-helix repeat-containing protein [Akkermansiaceae bacterium]
MIPSKSVLPASALIIASFAVIMVACKKTDSPASSDSSANSSAKVEPTLLKADFYVSPTGEDTSLGTLEAPFATLERAKLAVRELKQTKKTDILVYLRGGLYEFEQTTIFSLADSGSVDATITYAAYPEEIPVFSAGKVITNWEKPTYLIPGLPDIAQGNVMMANTDLAFRALFDSEGILPRAKSKGFLTSEEATKSSTTIPAESMKNWSATDQLEISVRPHHAWIHNLLPITSINYRDNKINTGIKATYAMNRLHFLKTTDNGWIENAIEELDEPGEWVINTKEKKVYLWPRQSESKNSNAFNVTAPKLNELIRIEGDIDIEGPVDTPTTHLRFQGITFKHGKRYQIAESDAGFQHDWNFFDKDNALVRLRGTEYCEVVDCHFLHSGSGALRLDLHAQHNTISSNHIEHMGGSGILLGGYGPGTKDVNKQNLVFNNHIHHVGEIVFHSPGIMLSQSGNNRIANNLIHHTNYTSIIISGCVLDFFSRFGRESYPTIRWQEIGEKGSIKTPEQAAPYLHTNHNLIEQNEIHHAMQMLGDGNAIYIRGAGVENIIKRNYIHHLVAPMIMQCAIRTDGGQGDTLITENIIYKCTSQGMMLKLNNRFTNNIIADVISPPRGYYLALREGPLTGASIQHNIFYSSNDVEHFVHTIGSKDPNRTEDRRGRGIARPEDADMDYNIYYAAASKKTGQNFLKQQKGKGIETHSLSVDPLFKDISNGDFTLLPNSPALELGFKPIDMSTIGLIKK